MATPHVPIKYDYIDGADGEPFIVIICDWCHWTLEDLAERNVSSVFAQCCSHMQSEHGAVL